MNNMSSTAKKIIKAALTETNPNSIAVATSLTVQAVYANLNNLKKHNLATYDNDAKILTLTAEGIRVANDIDIETNETVVEPVSTSAPVNINIIVTGTGTKKEKAWAIIDGLLAANLPRKTIVAQLVIELGVFKNNASAYYQNYRKAHGMVTPRVVTMTTTPGISATEEETEEVDPIDQAA